MAVGISVFLPCALLYYLPAYTVIYRRVNKSFYKAVDHD